MSATTTPLNPSVLNPSLLSPGLTQGAVTEIAALAIKATAVRAHPEKNGQPFVVLNDSDGGQSIRSLRAPNFMPDRPTGCVHLRDAKSLIAYCHDAELHMQQEAENAGEGHGAPRIYATLEPAKFVAVLNDHAVMSPGWRDWRADFVVPASHEWSVWSAFDRKPFTQIGFAEFLEDHASDVATPDGTALMEMVLNFDAAKGGSFKRAVRLQDGNTRMEYIDETSSRSGALLLPARIGLNIPVFENEQPSPVSARLKFRLKDSALSIWFEIEQRHKVLETAFRSVWDRIEKATGTTILLGTPE